MKQLIIFDLDGTLAESKSSIDSETAHLLNILLTNVKLGIMLFGRPVFVRENRYHSCNQ
ncbi:hypothetical protein [Arcicella rosea]|uniref:Hydroxymethylpyrimidine pyrophosphatase-like HAD family hydrolase n=1 Tax=Arcicella rosea TaxID=502909 RepID=A0A841EME4_9BACT|nr:hypothetical protein [Arcicella rosea]MBB6002589.1 hydroxymethylpyrimidine pyrophosphatase-like HAD family hydrolase [Arcicella rosea]